MGGATQSGVILIGTPSTVSQLACQLAVSESAPVPLGAILVESGEARGVETLGLLEDLPRVACDLRPSLALVSIPRDRHELLARVRGTLRGLGVDLRMITPIEDHLAAGADDEAGPFGRPRPAEGARRIDLAALLDRRPHAIDEAAIGRLVRGRRVLVTGAGGSIGSELCRLVAAFIPERLILMERAENALFEIDRRIASAHPDLSRRSVLHDVTDEAGTRSFAMRERPHVVIHAAAHKHVPLMEDHPADAVRNNALGTWSIGRAALEAGAERFVLISSDKAVQPRSVMGATKRLAETLTRALDAEARAAGAATRCAMVRFGNVLGSAGSVIPIWSAQLGEGGPITVTDERMTRYFMTIPEAAALVLQAAAFAPPARGSAVYVLDMGEPVSVLELARRFVRAHGLEPVLVRAAEGAAPAPPPRQSGIEIVVTGVRPGEKLHERLACEAEALLPTSHRGIRRLCGDADDSDAPTPDARALVRSLTEACASADRARVLEAIRRHVPEMGPAAPEAAREPEVKAPPKQAEGVCSYAWAGI